jgi:hypothetical protein
MKKFMASFLVEVYADTEKEARQIARRSIVLTGENELVLVEMKAETERCDICQLTYIPSEVVEIEGEQLCVYCRFDKYGIEDLRDEDIPF